MSEREQFESWASAHWRLCEFDTSRCPHQQNEYSEPEIQDAWEAWQAACPERWQCVPKEPTLGMLNEGHRKMFGHGAGPTSEVWDAMLSAAPTPGDV